MPKDFYSLRYPEDLGTDASPNYVTFSPMDMKYNPPKYGNPVDRGSGGLFGGGGGGGLDIDLGAGNPFSQLANAVGGQLTSLADAALDSIDAIGSIFESGSLSSAATAFGKIVNGKVRIGDFIVSSGIKTDAPQLNTLGSISLYLPQQLTSNTSANYENKELGSTGQIALEGSLTDSGEVGNFAKALIGETVKRSGQLGDILAIQQGAVVNPYSYQIFSGMQHRQFSYTFDFVPKNKKEAQEVANICDMFLFHMLPSRGMPGKKLDEEAETAETYQEVEGEDNLSATGKLLLSKHFLKMPCQWDITYYRNGNRLSNYIQEPNRCFLDSCNITYGGDSQNLLHTDGAPVKTTMELSFTEIEPLVQGAT